MLVGEDSAEKGLSLLVQQVLGKPLDKTEQMSNWKKRPLRIRQVRYAGKVSMHAQTDNDRKTEGRCSYHCRISKIILLHKPQTNPSCLFLSRLNLLLVADAYCLLDVYSVLSSKPAYFGLPADLRSISSSQSVKSGDKKQKEKQAEHTKQAHGKEVRSLFTTS